MTICERFDVAVVLFPFIDRARAKPRPALVLSGRGRVTASEADAPDEKLVDYIVSWPGKWPKGARGSAAPSDAKKRARGTVKLPV